MTNEEIDKLPKKVRDYIRELQLDILNKNGINQELKDILEGNNKDTKIELNYPSDGNHMYLPNNTVVRFKLIDENQISIRLDFDYIEIEAKLPIKFQSNAANTIQISSR